MDSRNFLWVNSFIKSISPYVFVRTEDNVLIKKPNHVQKINPTGAQILKTLLAGVLIEDLFSHSSFDETKKKETLLFLVAIKNSLEGNHQNNRCNPAASTIDLKAPFTTLPILSEVAITSKCNLQCKFCYAGINCNKTYNEKELTTEQWKTVLNKIFYEAKVPSVSFSGGEPTLRNDLPELIAHAKALGMRVNLISNGTLIDQQLAKNLALAGLDTAQISIEGTTAIIHDTIVGKPNSFEKAIQALEHFVALKIPVHGNTTLNKMNVKEALSFPSFYHSLHLDRFSMNMVIPTGSTAEYQNIRLSYAETIPVIEEIRKESEKFNIDFLWYSPIPIRMYNTIVKGLGNKGCAACDGLLSVNSKGEIIPCASWDLPIGNLVKHPFQKIWNSKNSRTIRNKQKAPSQCQGCDHFTICQGTCPLYWNVFGTKEIEVYCKKMEP